jgi:hypothetical protein
MSRRAFLFILPFLSVMLTVTSPPVLGTPVKVKVSPTITLLLPTVTSTSTPLADRNAAERRPPDRGLLSANFESEQSR